MTHNPPTSQQLDEIEACVTGPLGAATVFDHTTVGPLVAEVRRLRAALANEERQHGDTIDDRDHFHEMADKLAYAVAPEEVIGEHSSMNCPWDNALDLITPMAEVDKLRQQVAVFTTLAERWEQLANQGDTAIGHFEGPAAATLDAEVGERGRTYRKAAADVRDVVRTGRVPHDLMTGAELDGAEETHVVADDSDDPEHIDDCPGCEPATEDTLPEWLYQRFTRSRPHQPAWERLVDEDRAYWAHQAAAVRRAVARGGFKATTPA